MNANFNTQFQTKRIFFAKRWKTAAADQMRKLDGYFEIFNFQYNLIPLDIRFLLLKFRYSYYKIIKLDLVFIVEKSRHIFLICQL